MEDIKLNIQWFPGHMTKARRMIADNITQVDAVCEVLDARIPRSSRIPDIEELTAGKPRIMVLNRADQADPELTKRWETFYRGKGFAVLETDSKAGKGTAAFQKAVSTLLEEKIRTWEEKGQTGRAVKVMIVGVPNVGKSSFINRISGRKAAEASDRPGVTRGKQWVNAGKTLLLLDTPGILWPKFEDPSIGENLAYTGAIRDQVTDSLAVTAKLLTVLRERNPQGIRERLKFDPTDEMSGYEMLELAGRKRGFLISGGDVDYDRAGAVILDEFRAAKLGRVTLEEPEEQ